MTAAAGEPLLRVEHLSLVLGGRVHAVRDVSFELQRGEMLGIVGESGSGKSMTLRALTGLVPPLIAAQAAGRADWDGVDLLALRPDEARRRCARAFGFVFQDPLSSLNPGYRVGWQLAEALRHRVPDLPKRERGTRIAEVLERVGLPETERIVRSYPHELSGGMRQRVMIAMALLSRPLVLLADEPTTALDVTLSAEILDLIQDLQRSDGLATILVSHDLNLVATRCDRVLVMYAGRVVEAADARDVFRNPRHPYTAGLLAATVDPFREYEREVDPIPGEPLGAGEQPGCAFAPRCPHAEDRCTAVVPPLEPAGPRHRAACIRQRELSAAGALSAPSSEKEPAA